ncbi:MAG: cytochrome d ubiquinol oxidase subunit II [Deltaproteobacteria bacterium]
MIFSFEVIISVIMLISLILYALKGGADYGGGVWDLLAFGKRARKQREVIAEAISPVWEANHVWLILVIVILFTAFPAGFSTISTVLHIPLTLMLIGIVFRGSAFAFRTYDAKKEESRSWGLVFSVSSLITPVLLGVILGAIISGNVIVENGIVRDGFIKPWFSLFALFVGLFTLALFAYLAAVYLTLETDDEELQDDFRGRALISAVISGLLAIAVYVLSGSGAPTISRELSENWWAWGIQVVVFILAVSAFVALITRRFRLARMCAIGQVSLIILGWAIAQYPYLVEPNVTIFNAAAPESTLKLLLATLVLGGFLLLPSFYYLLRVFRKL